MIALRLALTGIGIVLPCATAWSNVSPRNSVVQNASASEKRDYYKRDARIKRKEARMNRRDREMDRLMRQRKPR
jgi:hypothetical protein